MGNSLRVARIAGIDVHVNASWLVAFFLVAWTLAVGLFPQQYGGLSATTYWVMGFAASLLLFASVLIHELAHSLVARSRGLPVRDITLFIFGGLSNIEGDARSPRDEFLVAIVGPITSFMLAAAFWAADRAVAPELATVDGVVSYLAGINVILAVFNMIPGFPLDGGRVLRAILWSVTNSLQRATSIASGIGRGVGYLFIFVGIYVVFTGGFISGLWLAFIGWFLSSAAEVTSRRTELEARLRGVTVEKLMNRLPITAGPNTRISELIDDYVLQRGIRAVPVVDEDGALLGMITLSEMRSVPRERWSETPARFAMLRATDLRTAVPRASAADALRAMAEHDINQMPVVENGHLVGLISRGHVIRFLQVREELGLTGQDEEERARRVA